jgi:hypothetical protein
MHNDSALSILAVSGLRIVVTNQTVIYIIQHGKKVDPQ